jgi:hypothetical protein
MGYFLLQTVRRQKRAAKLRTGWEEKGLHVPPFLIYSVTKRCNLNCKGCYARAQHRSDANEMGGDRIRALFAEARSLGISFILLAGGEPLMRKELIEIAAGFPEIIFPFFTNGLLIDGPMIRAAQEAEEHWCCGDIEGYVSETDGSRGEGKRPRLGPYPPSPSGGSFRHLDHLITALDTLPHPNFFNARLGGLQALLLIDYIPEVPDRAPRAQGGSEGQRERDRQVAEGLHPRPPTSPSPAGEVELVGCLAQARLLHISQRSGSSRAVLALLGRVHYAYPR